MGALHGILENDERLRSFQEFLRAEQVVGLPDPMQLPLMFRCQVADQNGKFGAGAEEFVWVRGLIVGCQWGEANSRTLQLNVIGVSLNGRPVIAMRHLLLTDRTWSLLVEGAGPRTARFMEFLPGVPLSLSAA